VAKPGKRAAARSPPRATPPTAPTERGQRTQRALMDAALDLMAKGRSFNSLSMREVTMAAGVVPTAFYRHYRDMNELGLALVDDCGRALRPLLRKARLEGASSKDIIRSSFLTYKKYVEEHPRYFMVASGERHGGSPLIRKAIRNEIDLFVEEMAQDVQALRLLPNMSLPTIRNICDLVVNTMLSAASEIGDLPKRGPQQERERTERYIQQLRVIFFGAAQWREKSATYSAGTAHPPRTARG
jgi:TetR/AcrR family transcriptional regulator, fatty acid biosynthesis regulator